jgi:antitoxin (DNA-binding transcriptional repressor) of toxin-antitoxin stability system
MKMVEVKQATAPLADYARDAHNEPVIITDHGRPIAALLPVTNADPETVGLSTNPQFLQLIERSRRRQETEGGISSVEMRRRLGTPRLRRARTRAKGGRGTAR